jgi:hypothetical protein
MSYQFLRLNPVLFISKNLTAPEWCTIYPPDDDQFFLWTQNRKKKKKTEREREKNVRGSVCNEWIIDPKTKLYKLTQIY